MLKRFRSSTTAPSMALIGGEGGGKEVLNRAKERKISYPRCRILLPLISPRCLYAFPGKLSKYLRYGAESKLTPIAYRQLSGMILIPNSTAVWKLLISA